MNESTQRLTFLLPKDAVTGFEMALREAGIESTRPIVKGKTVDPVALDTIVKIIVALGGGAGIAMIIQRVADAIVKIMHDGRTIVKVRHPTLGDYSFENMNAAQISEFLQGIARSTNSQPTTGKKK